MAIGPGKYDAECELARGMTGAQLCLLIVVGGKKGAGVSATAEVSNLHLISTTPALLRSVADQIERDAAELAKKRGS